MNEDEGFKIALRECFLWQLRLESPTVNTFITEESELTQILAVKLGFYLSSLPMEVELLSNKEVFSQFPEEDDLKSLANLDLHEQIRQIYSAFGEERIEFREFVRFIAFLNKCSLLEVGPISPLKEAYCISFFNDFLLETI
jgi:hypothetical protein